MKYFLKVVWAEAVKQHRNYFNNWTIYISLFIWPLFSFLSAYYSYSAFDVDGTLISYINGKNILVFLMLGYMAMSFFRSVVQSAWNFSRERQSGTLEYIYLSTANRLAVLMGNALSSVFESAIVMLVFGMLIIISNRDSINVNTISLGIVLIIFIAMALLWGVFLNACFLYSRDTDFLFTILEEPMEIFAGVKVPIMIFPAWAKIVSFIFPLTYVLEALRQVMLNDASVSSLSNILFACIGIIIVLLSATLFTIGIVEKHMRKTGNVVLF
ncbi:ABC-2 type transport system permease protein [Pseudobutyrivibrio sp. ACV-2]|uniref:ABC transporter permease n=1 Tax=Pseudobutyrivibrio sp. ACV-2 TaxID=1520801 RepID=UPI00089493F4|nr:ABC transporter permease [Pseudobutyrivibrio sp. ACV-2]SEA18867.1 ABC-2 type transport system permease protein [Pseudobutyrivibrio sp. ACV-2]